MSPLLSTCEDALTLVAWVAWEIGIITVVIVLIVLFLWLFDD